MCAGVQWRCNYLQHTTAVVAASDIYTLEVVCLLSGNEESARSDELHCAGSDMEVELVEEDQAAAWEETPARSTLPVASAVALCRSTRGRSREEWMAAVVQVHRDAWCAALGDSTRHGRFLHVWPACYDGLLWHVAVSGAGSLASRATICAAVHLTLPATLVRSAWCCGAGGVADRKLWMVAFVSRTGFATGLHGGRSARQPCC